MEKIAVKCHSQEHNNPVTKTYNYGHHQPCFNSLIHAADLLLQCFFQKYVVLHVLYYCCSEAKNISLLAYTKFWYSLSWLIAYWIMA